MSRFQIGDLVVRVGPEYRFRRRRLGGGGEELPPEGATGKVVGHPDFTGPEDNTGSVGVAWDEYRHRWIDEDCIDFEPGYGEATDEEVEEAIRSIKEALHE